MLARYIEIKDKLPYLISDVGRPAYLKGPGPPDLKGPDPIVTVSYSLHIFC